MKYLVAFLLAAGVGAGILYSAAPEQFVPRLKAVNNQLVELRVRAQSFFSGGSGPPAAARGPARFPVEVAPVASRMVEYTVTSVGSVEAFEVVQITARVAGVVERMRFAEGDLVAPGQVLAEVEPDRFKLAVQSSQATLSRAEAALAEAQAGLARREGANKGNPGLIPGEEMESWRTRTQSAAAEVAQARANHDLARLNLRDAFVKAPAAGVIQTRSVQTGQFVQPGAVMATLVRRDPLLLRFQVAEREAGPIHAGMPVAFTVGESHREYGGIIVLVAERAEPSSRMVAITAEVNGEDTGHLRPGAFAQVRVPVGAAEGAAVVPQMAVRASEKGFLAFVVEDSLARERLLTLGLRTADGGVEVKEGLVPGELLVIRGAEAVYDGAPVRVAKSSKEEAGR